MSNREVFLILQFFCLTAMRTACAVLLPLAIRTAIILCHYMQIKVKYCRFFGSSPPRRYSESNLNEKNYLKEPKSFLSKILLNDKFILSIIILNAIIIFLQESNVNHIALDILDMLCTFVFIIEMIVKHIYKGFKAYWTSPLNAMDGILVLMSIPSFVSFLFPDSMTNLSFLLVLRIFRVFRFFRLVSLFPNFTTIIQNFKLALRESYAIMIIMMVLIVTFSLIGCFLFKTAAPDYFATPLDAIYSTFRMFTVEGWYEIPDAVAAGMQNSVWVHVVRVYFSVLLLIGGIIGMSLINSIFVDAMVSDNNDDVKEQLTKIEQKLDELLKEKNK